MTLKRYGKAPIRYHAKPKFEKEIEIKSKSKKKRITVWAAISAIYSSFMSFMTISKVAGIIIPLSLILSGSYILYNQLWPEVEQYVLQQEGYLEQGTTTLVEDNYIEERQIELSDPGSEYFEELASRAFGGSNLLEDTISKNFNQNFTITIPSLDLYDVLVTPNVDSGDEESYRQILDNSLAHMSGTGLPISDVGNKTVIYGHSSNNAGNSDHPSVAFTRLMDLNIGDEIFIKINEEGEEIEYKYKVKKTKIVNPYEVDILTNNSGRKDLLGFTCFPAGNPAQRFVFEARLVD